MSGLSYLFIAYTIIWGALFLYLFRLHRRERRLSQDLEALQQSLKEKRG